VSNLNSFCLSKLGKHREETFKITNIGVRKPKSEDEHGDSKVGRVVFSQCLDGRGWMSGAGVFVAGGRCRGTVHGENYREYKGVRGWVGKREAEVVRGCLIYNSLIYHSAAFKVNNDTYHTHSSTHASFKRKWGFLLVALAL
jgi:hypothetical protein